MILKAHERCVHLLINIVIKAMPTASYIICMIIALLTRNLDILIYDIQGSHVN